MDDVISLSSGSEEDSDIEIVSSYRDDRSNTIPFIRAELLPVTPVLIDITQHCISSDTPRASHRLKKLPCSTIEIIDLSKVSQSLVTCTGKPCGKAQGSSYNANDEKDVICLDPVAEGNGGQSPISAPHKEKSYTNQHNGVRSYLQDVSTQRSENDSEHSILEDISPAFEISNRVLGFFQAQNTNYAQDPSPLSENLPDHDELLDSPQSWLNEPLSSFGIDSPYYCPSEIDDAVLSDESLILCDEDQKYKTSDLDKTESPFVQREKTHTNTSSLYPQTQSELSPQTVPTSDRLALPYVSPTSTELLAGESPDTESELHIESPPLSLVMSCYSLSPLSLRSGSSASVQESDMDGDCGDLSEHHAGNTQQISVVEFRKLRHLLGGRVQDMHTGDEDNKDFGTAEPLCRQSLSLVYSTIEENDTEGTLQLLSDLIQPCYYPPPDITAHLLRRILLEPQCTQVLALEAYNLLMRTQKYHPADTSTVPWDWQLLSSVMAEQDEARRLRSEVLCLLFQYVLQVLEDNFWFKLPKLELHLSVANKMLSCDKRFRHVRMLLILQRMLLLAMEVDLRPTCISTKLSEELCNNLNSMAPCRRLRLLLLNTLQSNLLRCKMVELLLDQSCSQKRPLPMSFKLLLHFLQTSTLAPDPSDGTERWRRWEELLQLVWMLMLSYQEVITGHLRCSITERFKLTRTPIWTQNDQVTRAAVREAAEAFLSRAVEDLGHDLPSQIQESLSQLQEHLLSISLQ